LINLNNILKLILALSWHLVTDILALSWHLVTDILALSWYLVTSGLSVCGLYIIYLQL
jgi:hypothetical protein